MAKVFGRWPIGVCSWSFHEPLETVAHLMKELGVEHIHLAVGPALSGDSRKWMAMVRSFGWTITSTMIGFGHEDYSTLETIRLTGGIVPDDHWETDRDLVARAVEVTRELKVPFLSFHAGFLDQRDPVRARTFATRMKTLADCAQAAGVKLLLETGQETAEDLAAFLRSLTHPAVRVNFDPANMILYGKGKPVEAAKVLAPWISHIHVKDAKAAAVPGSWGTETPWGDGEVGGVAFLKALDAVGFNGALAIEREGGTGRMQDVRKALDRCVGAG